MKNKLAILFSVIGVVLYGQTVVGVDTILKSGPISKRINLVILGDGYTNPQIPQFQTDATAVSNYLLNTPPFNNYQNYFNVFAIKCVSPQSGITHPGTATDVAEPASPVMTVSNYFDTQFDNYNTHRLIYSNNSAAVYSVLAANFPAYDQIVILGNSPEYGGAGGSFAVSSTHTAAKEIVVHEMGHSFADLADEYWAGIAYAAELANMTANSNTTTVKWAPWLGISATGVYAHGTTAPENGWFRPHQNCKMRLLNSPFCPVCKEAIIEKIHSLTNPIDGYLPANTSTVSVAASSQWFKTKLVKPNPNTLKRSWTLNATTLANNIDSVLINSSMVNTGNNTLTFSVMDTTALSKSTTHPSLHSYSVVWSVSKSTVGLEEIKPQLEFSVYPNPATDALNLSYTLFEESKMEISIYDVSGKPVRDLGRSGGQAGQYRKEIALGDLASGIYFLKMTVNGQAINHKFVVYK
jgi:hypothetical protein